jgi:hypothetical protein
VRESLFVIGAISMHTNHNHNHHHSGGAQITDTHEVAARKEEEVERLRRAFGI